MLRQRPRHGPEYPRPSRPACIFPAGSGHWNIASDERSICVLNRSDPDIEQDRHMTFGRSLIEGVEIKRCQNVTHAYKSHVHNELSLGYITEGSTDLTLSDKTIQYGPGDGVIIPH